MHVVQGIYHDDYLGEEDIGEVESPVNPGILHGGYLGETNIPLGR